VVATRFDEDGRRYSQGARSRRLYVTLRYVTLRYVTLRDLHPYQKWLLLYVTLRYVTLLSGTVPPVTGPAVLLFFFIVVGWKARTVLVLFPFGSCGPQPGFLLKSGG